MRSNFRFTIIDVGQHAQLWMELVQSIVGEAFKYNLCNSDPWPPVLFCPCENKSHFVPWKSGLVTRQLSILICSLRQWTNYSSAAHTIPLSGGWTHHYELFLIIMICRINCNSYILKQRTSVMFLQVVQGQLSGVVSQ